MFFRKVHMQRKDGGVRPIHVSENAGLSPSPLVGAQSRRGLCSRSRLRRTQHFVLVLHVRVLREDVSVELMASLSGRITT